MDLTDAKTVVILGGGQAGAQAAMSLRQGGYDGAIRLVCDEAAPPYQRPPLSKAFLKGEMPEERLYFKPHAWYADNHVDLILGVRGERIDRSARTVALSDGASLPYDALVLATGARPRPLPVPGADLGGLFDLRAMADVERLAPELVAGRRLVIVGAGYIGLECAAVARAAGLDVVVLEMAPRVLQRVAGPEIAEFYEAAHGAEGVDIRTGARLEALQGENGRVCAARLAGGDTIGCDLVLVGIGVLPNQEIAAEAGLVCQDGIVVDRDGRTHDPRVFAAGDCARRPLVHYGRAGRLESVHNAIEQGKLAAAAILGAKRPVEDTPWFWSDQYDLKLQTAGLNGGHDARILRGDPGARSFAVFYLRDGRLIAVDAVNAAPEFLASKKLIAAGAALASADLQDTHTPMKEIAARAAA